MSMLRSPLRDPTQLGCEAEERAQLYLALQKRNLLPDAPTRRQADTDVVHIEDIATALSRLCRFGGHTKRFYSVAEHSVLVSHALEEHGLALEGLLHDAAEAYVVDVPRPIKKQLRGHAVVEARVTVAICEAFGLPYDFAKTEAVQEADLRMLATEREHIMGPCERAWEEIAGRPCLPVAHAARLVASSGAALFTPPLSRTQTDEPMSTWKDFIADNPDRVASDPARRPATVGDVPAPERRRGAFRPVDLVPHAHPSEEDAQAAVIAWSKNPRVRARLPEARYLRHVPNGGERTARAGARMKRAGARPGTPDLLLPVPRQRGEGAPCGSGWWHGLWIELKRNTNDLSALQHEEMRALLLQGYATDTAHSARQAIALIEEYLTDSTAFVAGR